MRGGENTYSIIEIPRRNRLLHGRNIIRIWIPLDDDLHPLTQARELISDIPRSAEGFELQELFVAELLAVVGLGPLFPDVEQGEVVPAWADEVLSGLVGVELFVFGSVEEGARFGEHSDYGEDLLGGLVRLSMLG